jgi:hypothetical protein
MTIHLPDRSHFDLARDPDRALVALERPSAEDRDRLVRLAESAGLRLETGLEPELTGHVTRREGQSAVIRVQQDVTVTVDGLSLDRDDFVLKQEIRLDPKGQSGGRRPRRHRPLVAHSNRLLWLVGSEAVAKMQAAVKRVRFGSAVAVAPVYFLPGPDRSLARRYAADPWFLDIRTKKDEPHHPLPPLLEKHLTILKEFAPVGGRWLRAKLTHPIDLYEFACKFFETTGERYLLSLRGLPMIVPLAAFPPPDPDYGGMQAATLSHINAQNMWNVAGASCTSPVKIFYIDSGVFAPGGLDILVDQELSVYIDQPMPGFYQPGCTPASGDPHGTQMVGIAGAQWDAHHMAGVAGLRPNITHVSLRCASLGHISDALAYAGSVCGGEKGVVVVGLDVLLLYWAAPLCVATATEAARFDAALLTAMTTDDLLVVMPAGNYDVHGPAFFATIPAVPAHMDAALIVGAVDQSGTARWNDPTNGASRTGPGLSMVAPGDNVYTSYDTTLATPHYGQVFGTSFAAAHVAGIAALTRSAHPTMSAAAVKTKILGSCSWPVAGFTSEVGDGLVDGAVAVT